MSGWTPRELLYSICSFGRYRSECYFCEDTITGRNHFLMNLKVGVHLAFTHGEDPEDMSDEREDRIRDHMAIRGEGPNATDENGDLTN